MVVSVKQLFDVRPGEARGTLAGFGGLLLLVIAAHTILETARDALLLTGPGPRALGFVYVVIALGTVPGAALAARAGERYGQRRALGGTLVVATASPILLYLVPGGHAAAMVTYILSGILGSIIIPQFWMVVGTVLTVAQGRRLFSLISVGGIVGGVLGPASASATLVFLPVKALLVVSSFVFVVALVVLAMLRITERPGEFEPRRRVPLAASLRVFREEPYLTRVALVVFVSTATFLALDYLFKSTIARTLPSARIGPFVAHYYLGLNAVSLLVQLLGTSTVIRRFGVLSALLVTPLLLVGGAAVAFAGGGALLSVLLLKGIDGCLRYSVHRATAELMYLPVPARARQRAKPLIDGSLGRVAQTVTGGALLALGGTSLLGPRTLAAMVALLAIVWLATVFRMRRPYLRLLRSAITRGSFDGHVAPATIDLETAQLLVQRMASEDPLEVEGAMMALSRRGSVGLVSALVLLHRDEGVLVRALEIFGGSSRSDWFALARRVLDNDPRESVRIAAMRALARHEQLDAESVANHVGWRAQGYTAVRLALRDRSTEIAVNESVAPLLDQTGSPGDSARLGMLAAIADAEPTARLLPLLGLLAREPPASVEATELLAEAAARQGDPALVPRLVSFLSVRTARDAVRAALVALGEPALEEVWRILSDPTLARRLRLHMPKTLARFATRRAGEYLLATIETEQDGVIRYKAIRALRILVTEYRIRVDRDRVERLCRGDLEKYFRRLGLVQVFDVPAARNTATTALLLELLNEKANHALDRAFQLLEIAYPRQGVHRAYVASRSEDPSIRANATELLDVLLRRHPQQRLRALFDLATDDLPLEERVERSRTILPPMARTLEEGTEALLRGRDAVLVALGRRLLAPAGAVLAGGATPFGEGNVSLA